MPLPMMSHRLRTNSLFFKSVIFVILLRILSDTVGVGGALNIIFGALGDASILSILSARLLINMKEAGEKGLYQGTSCGSQATTISGMDFEMAPNGSTLMEECI